MANDVSTVSSAVAAMQPDWDLTRALLGGTKAMRASGVRYLPKWPLETQQDYDCRLDVAVLFPAYQRTIKTLSAKPFSKPLTNIACN